MDSELKVALVQSNLVWEDKSTNLRNFENKINSISHNIDLFLLPEMFSTGFSMNAKPLAEEMDGPTVTWMQQLSSEKKNALAGSLIIKDNGNFYNRFIFVHPSGKIDFYDKRHLFSLANEHKIYSKGNRRVLIEYKGWKILPQICYDLRFPVFSRNKNDYDVAIYVANWPKSRIYAWNTLLKSRAIENMSYVIGVNRVGVDGNNYEYNGASAVIDCLGNDINSIAINSESITTVVLKKQYLIDTRNKFNFLEDQDFFNWS